MKVYRRFLVVLTGVILAAAIMIAALVIYVDPFFQYHKPLAGFSYVIDNQLSQNPGLARNTEYNAVLLGSSVTVNFDTDWFLELYGLDLVKLPYNGAYPRDIVNAMEQVDMSDNRVDRVFLAVDVTTYSGETDEIKYEIPEYLYDEWIFNDVFYWYNKDVLLNYILKPLMDPAQGTDPTDYYSTWQYFGYSKGVTLTSYTPVERLEEVFEEDSLLPGVMRNMDENICPMIEAHPDTQFTVFFPPYSILYWYDFERMNQTDAILCNEAYIIERLLAYDNVEMYFYQNDFACIANLDNYTDKIHYSREVSYALAEAMAEGRGRITRENYEEVIGLLRDYVHTYDYDSIWDDFEHLRPEE